MSSRRTVRAEVAGERARAARLVGAILVPLLLVGCAGRPVVAPVQGFELERYLGKWHEIARLDHRFERGLEQVTAHYAMRPDGGVSVVNRGYLPAQDEWREAEGRAHLAENPGTGYLKVSFFGPFYGSYVIFELDKEGYQYAFVAGPDTSYLWLLSRTPQVEERVLRRFLERSAALGFDTSRLVYPPVSGGKEAIPPP